MKIYVPLFFCVACFASDKEVHISNTNNITVSQTQPQRVLRPGPKHPSVIEAHERLRREQEEQDAVTCCCFFKIKKRI